MNTEKTILLTNSTKIRMNVDAKVLEYVDARVYNVTQRPNYQRN